MVHFSVRTDLAVEAREVFEEDNVEIKGVILTEDTMADGEVKRTIVKIETENGAKMMGKPKGTYVTLEADSLTEPDEDNHPAISNALATVIKDLLPHHDQPLHVLIVGLGNRNVTPDALGPKTVDLLLITRHIAREYGLHFLGKNCDSLVSGIVPGVMAQTGMESVEIIQGVVERTHPDLVLVVDALAARSIKRLNRTIQVADSGIHPGAGVGNHRNAINEETLGVPVISLGIPTVVDAATIVYDTISETLGQEPDDDFLSPGLKTMFVTPKDIDESIDRLSFTLSEGLNRAFSAAVFQD